MEISKISLEKIVLSIVLSTFIVAVVIVMSAQSVYGMQITEIMFNPEGADTGREWIEVWDNESRDCVNLTSYRLFEEGTNHNIYKVDEDLFCGYAIISNNPETFLQEHQNRTDLSVYRSSFSLSNNGEILAIKKNSEIIEYVNYSILLQYITVEEGHSLELSNNTWTESSSIGGSPGMMNEDYNDSEAIEIVVNDTQNDSRIIDDRQDIINETIINDTIIEDAPTNSTSINHTEENEENVSLDINISQDVNISQNISSYANLSNTSINISINISNISNVSNVSNASNIPNASSENDSQYAEQQCRVSIKIFLKNESLSIPYVNENDAQIKFYNKLEFLNGTEVKNYSIEYWIEDAAGNIVKNKIITNNQDEKSFTPKIEDVDKILYIKAMIKDIDCNVSRHYDEKILLIKNRGYSPKDCQTCECEHEPDKKSSSTSRTTDDIDYMKICKDICPKNATSNAPAIKIVNVCNDSSRDASLENIIKNSSSATLKTETKSSSQSSITGTQALSDNNSKKSIDKGMTTGMIVYESPNVKNRFYAIVGFMLVGLALIIITGYRFLSKRASRTE